MKKVVSGQGAVVSKEGPPKLFKRSVWKHGLMNYECQLCAYATLDAVGMAGHLRAVHGIERTVGTANAELDGAPIILIEESEA
jgi:hypothetical protein